VWCCLGFFLLSRVPAMQCPYQLDVDEGQMLAQAMRYEHHLTPWRAVDGETGGPLLSWVPLLAHKAGLPLDFRTAHLLAVLCLAGTLLATYAAAARLLGEEAGLAALAAGAWWLALAPGADFIHYSSELVPILLLSCALASFVGPGSGGGRILLSGLLLGLIPWAKLQAVPIGLILGLWCLVDICRAPSLPTGRRWQHAGLLLGGAVGPSILMLGWVVHAGAWEQFWNSYLVANLSRAAGKPWSEHGANLLRLVFSGEGASWFLDAGLLAAGALWLRGRAGWCVVPGRIAVLVTLLLAVAVFAVLRPVTQYPHYQQLCLVPLLLVVAVCARVIAAGEAPATGRSPHAGWAILAIGLLPVPMVYFWHNDGIRALRETSRYERSPAFEIQSFVDSSVRHFVPEPSSLAVWGWAPFLYVDLGIPPGTRDAGYTSLHDGNPSQEFMRAAFLRDLTASSPQVIVDTEDYIVDGVRKTAPAIFPAFADYLRENYRLIGRGTATRGRNYSVLVDVYLRGSRRP
jgi:hypothetical protein